MPIKPVPGTHIHTDPDGTEWGVSFEAGTDRAHLRVRRWNNGHIAHHPTHDNKPFPSIDAANRYAIKTGLLPADA